MRRGITDFASSEDGKLTADAIHGRGGGCDDVQGADTFAVQTSVLGETLADQHRNTAVDEFPDGPGVPVQIATGETLIGTVEEGIMALLQHHVCDLAPLFSGGINTGWVVSAGVKEKDGAVRSGGEGSKEFIAGEGDSLRIVVRVGEGIDPDVSEDSEVVCCKKEIRQRRLATREASSDAPQVGSVRYIRFGPLNA